MAAQIPDITRISGIRCPHVLYGTARPIFRSETKSVQSMPAAQSQREVIDRRHKKQRGGRLRMLVKKCFPCFHKSQKSYSPEQASILEVDLDRQDAEIRMCSQDHDKDAIFQHLITNTGRISYPRDVVSAKSINISLRKLSDGGELDNRDDQGVSDETSLKVQNENMRPPSQCLPGSEETKSLSYCQSDDLASGEASSQHTGQGLSKQNGIVSGNQTTKINPCSKTDDDAVVQKNVIKAEPHDMGVSLVEDLKNTVHDVSARLNLLCDQENLLAPRPPVRERSVYMHISKFRFQYKHLLSFRYPARIQQSGQVHMMDGCSSVSSNDLCYPRYSDGNARRESLRRCTEVQLSGYEQEELVRGGWFFNGRILATFCCGMEMPITPEGHPLDVHLGLSPQCQVAVSLQNHVPDSNTETQDVENGEVGFHFSIPVQATDDDPAQADMAAAAMALNVQGGFPSVGFQESIPGDHWEANGAGLAITQTSGASYYENLVTNSTQLLPGPLQNNTRNQQQSSEWQRPGGIVQNLQSRQRTHGQLSMRGNAANLLGNERPYRDQQLELSGRQSPPPGGYFPPLDQLTLDANGNTDHEPRYPHLGFPAQRLITFDGWPPEHAQSPSSLADAGFFYAGYGDGVLCYSCGIGVHRWQSTDDAWIEHARFQPSCVFVKTIQGQHFIDVAREMTRNNRHPTYQEVKLEANRRRRIAEGGDREDGQGESLEVDEMLCKMCYIQERNFMLMPCRHLAVCETCLVNIISCPICHSFVETFLRASFG